MKTKNYLQIILLCILVTGNFSFLFAHGEGHESPKKTDVTGSGKYFSTEAASEKFELLLRYEPISRGQNAHMTLFVSDFITNMPLNKAIVKISAQEDTKLVFTVKQTEDGTYLVEGTFPENKKYSLAVNLSASSSADLILLENIEVGKELPHEEITEQKSIFSNWLTWVIIGISLLTGTGLGVLISKRNSRRGKVLISLFLIACTLSWPVTPTLAHGDDDHGPKKQSLHFSNTFPVPKETQFLFEIFTEKTSPNHFTESTSLFGTIVPSSKGHAVVSSPQSGKIISLRARVGEEVRQGQVLAVIEQNIDAGTQLNLATQKNILIAEYESSKKNWERIFSIQDIASKKELDEAKARFQIADSNLKLINSSAGKFISLNAPISGMVGNFSMTTGSTINAGENLFTITDLSYVYAEAQVFDKDAGKVKQGAKFTIECSNDNHKTSEVQLLSLAQEINVTNQSQKVLFELRNPDADFKIGEFVNIRVFASEPSRLIALPNSAFTEINGKPVVFVKDGAEKYSIRYVQVGENNGSYTTILKGVEEGERVVINGSYQMKMIFINQ